LVGALLLVAIGAGVAFILIKTKPKAKKQARKALATLVEVQPLKQTREQVRVRAMGTVEPARQVSLQPRVGGEVVEVSPRFIPGGVFKKGEVLLKLDPVDYEILVTQRAADLAKAENDFKVELGRQDIAKRDWELASKGKAMNDEDRELVLRVPQLRLAKAVTESARGALKRAKLDLARTTIRAPFNAIIRSRGVEAGAQVTPQTRLAELTGYDEYWVKASIPADKLRWLAIPSGSKVTGGARAVVRLRALQGQNHEWRGEVIRRLVELEPQGRMAQLLVSVKDPLGLAAAEAGVRPLLLGSYVELELLGIHLDQVYRIPRTAVRDGGTVWLMDEKEKLVIRPAHLLWKDRDWVLMKNGFEEGENLVVSDIPVPVAGLPLRLAESKSQEEPKELLTTKSTKDTKKE
jgi:RND family efflux transporter MFP subunit